MTNKKLEFFEREDVYGCSCCQSKGVATIKCKDLDGEKFLCEYCYSSFAQYSTNADYHLKQIMAQMFNVLERRLKK